MRDQLSIEQINSYREQGFLVIEDFLDVIQIAALRDAVLAAAAARGDRRLPGGSALAGAETSGGTSGMNGKILLETFQKHRRQWTRVLDQHINLWRDDDGLRTFVTDPRLGRMATELEDLKGVRLWHDQTMIKPAWGEPTGWHTDNPAFSFTHTGASTFWIALDDADLRNGCLHYLPGTHRDRITTGGRMRIDGLRDLHPGWEMIDPVPCPVRAGGLIVHNGDTAHGAGANLTPRARCAIAISWQPLGAVFDGTPNILPPEALACLRPGDTLDLDDLNPIVYRR